MDEFLVAVAAAVVAVWLLVALKLVAQEFTGRAAKVPSFLIRVAAAQLPQSLREEYEEEWYAELFEIRRKFEATPITRWIRVSQFLISLLTGGRSVGRQWAGEPSASARKITYWSRLFRRGVDRRLVELMVEWTIKHSEIAAEDRSSGDIYTDTYRDEY